MAWVRCEKGHYFDDDRHSFCPYCGVQDLAGQVSALRSEGLPESQEEKTVRLDNGGLRPLGGAGEGETVAYVRAKTGMDPVTGWLVCIEGPDRGRDFRLRSEKNSIGRQATNDIPLSDETVSRENHGFVVFDPRKIAFSVRAGDGRGLLYKNGEEVPFSEPLKAYDVIEVGRTKLLFVPLCGEAFQWK
ncbi:MAG: FHA domain-containing protein [Synergistaceae bacterium]|nr:FHA domain-containing protein [Synergistaceae bacterium]